MDKDFEKFKSGLTKYKRDGITYDGRAPHDELTYFYNKHNIIFAVQEFKDANLISIRCSKEKLKEVFEDVFARIEGFENLKEDLEDYKCSADALKVLQKVEKENIRLRNELEERTTEHKNAEERLKEKYRKELEERDKHIRELSKEITSLEHRVDEIINAKYEG